MLTEPSAAGEHVVLDPTEVAEDRTELDITAWIRQEGIDWGDAEIQAYVAEQARGESPVDFRIPNRLITVPLIEAESGGTAYASIRSKIQSKVARLQQEGGWVKRVTNGGGTVFADVVNASLRHSSVAGWESRANVDIDAQLTLEVIPDFYGEEITLDDHTETTAAELIFTETGIDGDYPARVRIVVDDDSGTDQHGLMWSIRSRHYSGSATAATAYEAEQLTPGNGTALALAGASGGSVITSGEMSSSFAQVVRLRTLDGDDACTHTGTNRVYARVYSTDGTALSVRLRWTPGDSSLPEVENPSWQIPAGSAYFIADLGEVRLDPAPVGTHLWTGNIDAKTTTVGGSVSIDKVWIVNADEGKGVLRAETTDAVLVGSNAAQVSTQGMFRTNGGVNYGPIAEVTGDLPRLPPSGLEGRVTEVFVKASRGHIGGTVADSGIDDISAQVFYRPSWLFVPEA